MKKLFTGSFVFLLFFQGCGQSFSPSPEYIAHNKNKWNIELPEVQELVHIIIAISPTGISDSNMVEHRTAYYRNVLQTFEKYKNDKIVKTVDKLLKRGFYSHLKMDAYGFLFNEDNRIIKDRTYKKLNWNTTNLVEPYTKELEAFATKTRFRDFYSSNKKYYDELIAEMRIQMPIEKQWRWLEERFPILYDNYRITFSPLVSGSHSTNRFETDGFKQTVMFICGPIESQQLNANIKEGLMSRVVFTEIDHNYVNPISDQYKKEINEIFSDRSKWTSGKFSNSYASQYSVFNEYMTWAVFTLYALDTFDENDFKIINERTELQMTNKRGFPRFKEFNQKMIELYKNKNERETFIELFPKILEWCKQA